MGGIMVVLGTRPEAIKLIPVIAALKKRGIPTRICATAQHRELLDQVLIPEKLTPDIDLDLMRPGQTLTELTATLVAGLGSTFARERPDRVVVQGDTATAFAAAHAAFLSHIPVGHVEAGLRTGDLAHPHPEEGHRAMIARVADLHFAPTARAADNLLREGIIRTAIHITGNPVADALCAVLDRLAHHAGDLGPVRPILEQARGRHLILVTCHRRENHSRLDEILSAIRRLAARPDVLIALPVHPHPEVRTQAERQLQDVPNLALLPALDFLTFVALLSRARLVLTDSGGVQEEAPMLGVPVLVLRETTERPEGIEAGTAMLVGTNPVRIVNEATRLLDNPFAHARMARRHSPYGDGKAGERIAAILAESLGCERRPGAALPQQRLGEGPDLGADVVAL